VAPSEITRRVFYWANKAGLSPYQLALRIGVHNSAVYHWKAGRSSPSHESIQSVAQACGVTMEQFWSPRIRLPSL